MVRRNREAEPSGEETKLRHTDFSQKVLTLKDITIYCRSRPVWDTAIKEVRSYFVGTIPLAVVDVFKPGLGGFHVKVTDRSMGNGAKKFATELEVHAFLAGLLGTKPTP